MNNCVEMTWREAVVAYSEVLPYNLRGGTEKN
jgi:hypothetical protein